MTSGFLRAVVRWLPLGLFLLLLATLYLQTTGPYSTDTQEVVDGTGAIVRCVEDGTWSGCEQDGVRTGVGPFPPAQYIPGTAMRALGFGGPAILDGLVALNGIAFFALLALLWRTGRGIAPGTGPLLVIAALTGPLLWYAHTGFGESLAALLTAALAAAVVARRGPVAIGVLAFAAALTKETAAPFLLVLVAAWGLIRWPRGEFRHRMAAAVAGAVAAVAVTALFNVFRFGGPLNDWYGQDLFRMDGVARGVGYFAAQFVSPGGGLVWFWPLAVGLIAAAATAALRAGGRERRSPALAAALLAGLLAAAFAAWYSPFGWHAWGPRLMVPWIPALVLLAVAARPGMVDAVRRWLARPWAVALAALALLAAAAPHVGVTRDSSRYVHGMQTEYYNPRELAFRLFTRGGDCARAPWILDEPNRYYDCMAEHAWRDGLAVADGYRAFGSLDGWRYLVLLGGAIASLLVAMRRPLA